MGVFAAFSGGKIFSGFPGFSAPTQRGARTASACSPLTGGSFSAPESRGARTALACSPFPGGEFFAEPQRGDSPSADGGSVAAPAAGAKRKDNLRFSFLFELLPFPCFLIWRRLPTCDRCEKGNGRGFFLPCLSQPVRRIRYTYCYTYRILSAGRGIAVPRNSLARYYRQQPAKINCYQMTTFVGAVRKLQTNELRDTGMSRLRRCKPPV